MMEFICICCPRGCHLVVDEKKKTLTGYSCPRGASYGLQEAISPTRTVCSTVVISGASVVRLPVKTDKPIPKGKIDDVMKEINKVRVKSPIKIGEIIIKNVCETGSNIVATKSL